MRLADVARDLGVTRQTVYRYFPNAEGLLVAVAMRSADGFLDQLSKRLGPETDPVAAMVEGLAYGIETLGADSDVTFLLTQRQSNSRSASVMSETSMTFGLSMLHKLNVDWRHYGFEEPDLNELSEFCLRILYSFLADPGHPPRRGAELRRFLTRWLGPAIAYPRLQEAMRSLELPPASRPRRRRSAS